MTLLTGACSGSERDEVAVVTSPDPNSMVFCIVFFAGIVVFLATSQYSFSLLVSMLLFFVMI